MGQVIDVRQKFLQIELLLHALPHPSELLFVLLEAVVFSHAEGEFFV